MLEWSGSRPPVSRPLRVAAAAPSAGSRAALPAALTEATALPLPRALPTPRAFRLASTSAARGVLAGRWPGVGAGALVAVAGPAAGARRCSKGVAGTPAACIHFRMTGDVMGGGSVLWEAI